MIAAPARRPVIVAGIAGRPSIRVVQESLKVPARVWRDAFAAMLDIDVSAGLRSIAAPALILWGDRDLVAPASEQDALADAIRASRLVVYPETGHALHWESPERCAADLAQFCGQISAGDGPGETSARAALTRMVRATL
jgi:pimeloyl-ACP methyl ester carboxylesterase